MTTPQEKVDLESKQAELEAEASLQEHKLRMIRYFTQSNSDDPAKVATAINKYATSQS